MAIDVDPEWWKKIFDDVYLITDARSVCDPGITAREVDLVCEMLALKAEHRILDLCGGHGRHAFELCSRGYKECTLVDFSPYLTDYAKAEAAKLGLEMEIRRADARDTGLEPGKFDSVVIMGNSMGYLQEESADLDILREACRLLQAGGKVLVDVVNGSAIHERFNPVAWHEIGEDIVVCREREIRDGRVHAREVVLSKSGGLLRDQAYSIKIYEPDSLRALMEGAGFKSIEIRTDFSPHALKGDYGCMNNRMVAVGLKNDK
jgi:D-alanine-D-alanine ligase